MERRVRRAGTIGRCAAFALVLTCALALVGPLPALAQAKLVTSTQLIEQNKNWNNKKVTFQGEVIGDVMRRGDFAWINVNDDAYQRRNVEEGQKLVGYNSGQSVWVPSSLVEQIQFVGGYDASGDIVRVTGIFRNACPEHGGDMDIHASTLSLVTPGHVVAHPFDFVRLLVAIALLVTGWLFYGANKRAERAAT